jgi:hypothetical protein
MYRIFHIYFLYFYFIFYCRIKHRVDLEEIGWKIFHQTHWPCQLTYGNLLLAQNIIVFNQNIEHMIYFIQRMYIENYLQRVIKDKESTNRFFLLLYCGFIEMGGNR